MPSTTRSDSKWLRIGEVVRRTGLTERSLRHYESEGLIDPPPRSAAGYRLYDTRALGQIHQLLALKALGWSLAQIAARRHDQADPRALLDQQIRHLADQIDAQQALLLRLQQIRQQLASQVQPTTHSLLDAIEVTHMYDRYFTQEQQAALRQRAAEVSAAGMEDAQQAWPRLIAEVSALRAANTPANDPRVVELARQWMERVRQFTGGDPAIAGQLTRMYQQEPAAQQQFGLDPALMVYVRDALASTGSSA